MDVTDEKRIDIKLDENFQPVVDSLGAPELIEYEDCLAQDICIEALTEEGELFDETEAAEDSYGFGMSEFIQDEHDDFFEVEVNQRIKEKLEKRICIDDGSIKTAIGSSDNNSTQVSIAFKLNDKNDEYNIDISSDDVEVNIV